MDGVRVQKVHRTLSKTSAELLVNCRNDQGTTSGRASLARRVVINFQRRKTSVAGGGVWHTIKQESLGSARDGIKIHVIVC